MKKSRLIMAERLEIAVESAKNALKIEKLREYQKSAVIAVLQGKDVFVSQPTGAGKSLVYQMLPFAVEKFLGQGHQDIFVLVVSPLVSLIRDQTMILKKLGIAYFCLSSGDGKPVTIKDLKDGCPRIVFASPEALLNTHRSVMRNKDIQQRLSAVVVDESHCIVKWYKLFISNLTKIFHLQHTLDCIFIDFPLKQHTNLLLMKFYFPLAVDLLKLSGKSTFAGSLNLLQVSLI